MCSVVARVKSDSSPSSCLPLQTKRGARGVAAQRGMQWCAVESIRWTVDKGQPCSSAEARNARWIAINKRMHDEHEHAFPLASATPPPLPRPRSPPPSPRTMHLGPCKMSPAQWPRRDLARLRRRSLRRPDRSATTPRPAWQSPSPAPSRRRSAPPESKQTDHHNVAQGSDCGGCLTL